MFAYCGNNPVVRKDISGYGWKEIWGWVVDVYERITSVQTQQQMVNNQILQEQIEMTSNAIADVYERATYLQEQAQIVNNQVLQEQIEMTSDATDAIWDAYMRGYNLQQEAQLQNSMALVDGAKWCFNNPEETIDLALAAGGVSSVVYKAGIAAVTGNPVTGVVGVTMVAIWGIYRAIKGALL